MNYKLQITSYKLRKGFTIIELTIAMAILAIIMAATISMFVTGLKNYQYNFQKSTFQKELNYTVDSIANDVKNGVSIPTSHDIYTTSSEVLIISLPATDESDNFVYNGDVLELDYVVYYLSNNTLRKHIYGNPLGKRSDQNGNDRELLSDVSAVNFQFIPGIGNASQVKISASLAKQTGKVNVTLTEERTANLRNKQQ